MEKWEAVGTRARLSFDFLLKAELPSAPRLPVVQSKKVTQSDLHCGEKTPALAFQVKPTRNWTLKVLQTCFQRTTEWPA